LLRLLVDVFHRSRHAPHTLYPIDLSDHEINELIFASDRRKPEEKHATPSKLSVHKIQMIMAAMMGRRLHRIFQILQHQTKRIFHAKDLQLRVREHHQAISQNLKRGRAIATDLMYYANAIGIDRHPTVLNTTIKDAVTMFQSDNPALKITAENSSTPICLNADSNLLRRMILEILTNAKDAIPRDGEVNIKLDTEKATECDSSISPPNSRKVTLLFEDNGPGVSEHLGLRAFEPFTTLPKSRKQGMGLAVVFGIVKAHGGRIRFFNRLNGGLVLIIDLPL
jgi:signal transduction histidine kinase